MTPEEQLARIYAQAARQLRVQLRQAIARGATGTASYRATQLHRVQTLLRQLGVRSKRLEPALVMEPYLAAAIATDAALGIQTGFAFAGAHERTVRILAANVGRTYAGARLTVGRQADDVFRRAAIEAVTQGVAQGSTRRETSRRLERELLHQGVTAFTDKRGARWQLDTYAEMVARTTTREATSAATEQRLLEHGEQLITISAHGTECEICGPYEGRTFALPGLQVAGHPTIDRLPPFHPNCLHVATPAAGSVERFLEALERRAA